MKTAVTFPLFNDGICHFRVDRKISDGENLKECKNARVDRKLSAVSTLNKAAFQNFLY